VPGDGRGRTPFLRMTAATEPRATAPPLGSPAEGRVAGSPPAILGIGIAAITLVVLGPLVVLMADGLTPLGTFLEDLTSPPAVVLFAITAVAGLVLLAWGLAKRRREDASTRRARIGIGVGAGLVLVVPAVTALLGGMIPYERAVASFTSTPTLVLLLLGGGLGVTAILWGFTSYSGMPTKRGREQAIAGGVLGIQAVVVAGLLLAFRTFGDPDRFFFHFLNFGVVTEFVGEFVKAAGNTLLLAVIGELGGIVLGLLLALLTLSKRAVVRAPARVYINFFRGTPLIWQLSVFYFGLALGLGINLDFSIGPVELSGAYVTAMIVFILNTGAYAAEVFRAGIQSIERGQMEAARSLGMSYGQAMRYAIVPQAFRRVIPPLMNEFVILIKDTSLIVVLGLLPQNYDLFTQAREGYSDTFNATFFTAAALGYLAVTLPLIRAVNAVERRLRSGLVGVGA
jgi:His/Glu/Gln/Arg/opine family amino acid ABC transporter permease subunit